MNNNNRPYRIRAGCQKNFVRFSIQNFSKSFTQNPKKDYSYLSVLKKVRPTSLTFRRAEYNLNSLPFFNRSFDKKRLKLLFSWYYANKGEYAAFSLIETLQKVGFTYAMQAGISLGVDDLKVPPTKGVVLTEAVELLKTTKASVERGSVTPLEEFQQFVDTWHRTSENLKTAVVQNFTKNVNNRFVLKSLGEKKSFSKTPHNSLTTKDKNNLVKNNLIGLDRRSYRQPGESLGLKGGGGPKGGGFGPLGPSKPSSHFFPQRLTSLDTLDREGKKDWHAERARRGKSEQQKGRAHRQRPKATLSGEPRSWYGNTLNPVYMMAFSGARGNLSQVRQLVGMRGLMADPQGQLVEFPIQSNFREGLTVTEYMISCYGARKGLVDTALRTAAAGYLTRRLVDVSHHQIVRSVTCGTKRGIGLPSHLNSSDSAGSTFGKAKNTGPLSLRGQSREVNLPSAWKVTPTTFITKTNNLEENQTLSVDSQNPNLLTQEQLYLPNSHKTLYPQPYGPTQGVHSNTKGANNIKDLRITTKLQKPLTLCIGRVLARDIPGLAFRNQEIDFSLGSSPMLRKIYETTGVYVRSPLTCQSEAGICQLCYGWSVSANRLVGLGEAVGIIAAQSIGEPGTQLTMRTFHTGGVFSGDIMEECRAKHKGVVYFEGAYLGLLVRTAGGAIAFCIKTAGILHIKGLSEQTTYTLSPNSLLFVRQGERVENGGLLAQIPNLPEIEETTGEATKTIVSTLSGEVRQVPTVNSELANIRVLAGQKLPNQNFFYLKTFSRSVSQTKQENKKIKDNTTVKKAVKIIPGVHRWATQSLYHFKQNSVLDLWLKPKIKTTELKTQTLYKLRFFNSLNIVVPSRSLASSLRVRGVNRDEGVGFCEAPQRLLRSTPKALGLSARTKGLAPLGHGPMVLASGLGSNHRSTGLRRASQKPPNNQPSKSTGSFSNKTVLTTGSGVLKTVINALPNPLFYGVFYSPKYNENWTRVGSIPSNNVYKKFRPLWLTSRKNLVGKIKGTTVANTVVSNLDPFYLYYQKTPLNNSIKKSLNVLQTGLINCNLWWPGGQADLYEILESELNPFSTLLLKALSTCRDTAVGMPSALGPSTSSAGGPSEWPQGPRADGSRTFKRVEALLCNPIKLQLVFYLVNFLELQNYGYLFWQLSAIKRIKYYADFEKFKTQTVHTVDSDLTVQKSTKFTRHLSVQWWGYEPNLRSKQSSLTPLAMRLGEATTSQSMGSPELRLAPFTSLVLHSKRRPEVQEARQGPSEELRSKPDEHTGSWVASEECQPLDVVRGTLREPARVLNGRKGLRPLDPTTTTPNTATVTFGLNLLGAPRNSLTGTFDRWNRPLWSHVRKVSNDVPLEHDFWVRPFEAPVRVQFDRKTEKPFYKSNLLNWVDSNTLSGEICPIQGSTSIKHFKKNNYWILGGTNLALGLLRSTPKAHVHLESGSKPLNGVLDPLGARPSVVPLKGKAKVPNDPGPSPQRPFRGITKSRTLREDQGPAVLCKNPMTNSLVSQRGTERLERARNGKKWQNNINSRFNRLKNSSDTHEVDFRKNLLTHIDRISYKLQLKKRSGKEKKPYHSGLQIGRFIGIGDELIDNYGSTCCGQIIEKSTSTLTLRLTQNFLYSNLRFRPARLSQGVQDGNWLSKGSSLVTLPYISSVTGDIVAGIPKIEQLFEARGAALEETVNKLWNSYQLAFVPKSKAVRECFKEIGLFVVAAIQNVYSSQGVHIADKHLEVITRQMTKRALITDSGDTEFLPDEFVDLQIIECVNWSTYGTEASYCPRLIGITKASLTSNSFLSSASFQQTARVLEKEALLEKTDRLLGLKERVMMGALINAGTGGFQTDVLLSSSIGRTTKSVSPSFFKKLNFFSGSKINQFKEKG